MKKIDHKGIACNYVSVHSFYYFIIYYEINRVFCFIYVQSNFPKKVKIGKCLKIFIYPTMLASVIRSV